MCCANPVWQRPSTTAGEARSWDKDDHFDYKLLKPLPSMGWSNELRDLAATIQRDIFTENPHVSFDDVAGLESAKRVLREAVVMPVSGTQMYTMNLKCANLGEVPSTVYWHSISVEGLASVWTTWDRENHAGQGCCDRVQYYVL